VESNVINKAEFLDNEAGVKSTKGLFRNKAFELLEESSTRKGCPESMKELQSQIESLQVTNIEEASDIIKKYPRIMSLLIDHKLMTAKSVFLLKESRLEEDEFNIINEMDRYDLEVIAVKVLSSLFEEFGEKTMARTSTFLEQLARHIRFHVEVVTKRKKEVFGVPKPSEPASGESVKAEEVPGNKNKKKSLSQ
jgi:hypothetical protein